MTYRDVRLLSERGEPYVWGTMEGPTLAESEEYTAKVQADPDLEPSVAALPRVPWSVVVFGTGSMNTTVAARTAAEAERLAIAGFESGNLEFDYTSWGHLEAEAERA